MGRGCNRKTLKMRRRNSWRRHKSRLRSKIENGKAAAAGGKKTKAPSSSATSSAGAVRRSTSAKTANP